MNIIWFLDGNCWSPPAFPSIKSTNISMGISENEYEYVVFGSLYAWRVPGAEGHQVYFAFCLALTSQMCHFGQTPNWIKDVNKYIWGIFIICKFNCILKFCSRSLLSYFCWALHHLHILKLSVLEIILRRCSLGKSIDFKSQKSVWIRALPFISVGALGSIRNLSECQILHQ